VQTNNDQKPGWDVSVTSEDVTYYSPGETVDGYGMLQVGEHAVAVIGRLPVEFAFARVLGIEGATATRSATALAEPGGGVGEGLLFAGETDPSVWALDINGSDFTVVEGNIHSNTRLRLDGSNQTVSGTLEYLHQFSSNGSDLDYGDVVESQVMPYPVGYTWEQFDVGPWTYECGSYSVSDSDYTVPSGRHRIHGNMTIDGSCCELHDSLFVVDGDIFFNGSNTTFDHVTLVAQGRIVFNGSCQYYTPFQDDLFAMSLSTRLAYDDPAI
jgi:hypothetical protein